MFFHIAIKISIILNLISILTNLLTCFFSSEHKYYEELNKISIHCRRIGAIYMVLALLMGDGAILESGKTTYAHVSDWMCKISIAWIITYLISLCSRLWSRGEKMAKQNLLTSFCYFIVSFLIH